MLSVDVSIKRNTVWIIKVEGLKLCEKINVFFKTAETDLQHFKQNEKNCLNNKFIGN